MSIEQSVDKQSLLAQLITLWGDADATADELKEGLHRALVRLEQQVIHLEAWRIRYPRSRYDEKSRTVVAAGDRESLVGPILNG